MDHDNVADEDSVGKDRQAGEMGEEHSFQPQLADAMIRTAHGGLNLLFAGTAVEDGTHNEEKIGSPFCLAGDGPLHAKGGTDQQGNPLVQSGISDCLIKSA
ncbi:hypothetical protein GCWU000342_01785 [Shuttleworthella satelles DSM 14600]|uniref:Uncharacterized protein n=1 Tax=Shuttleworthella satelles DSM 14600 TaxID=626523 RepID=C4GCU1_9FIRM|nr:hypothetical protein GCWU000342_01785 [Shuttleworthia satelles DSM 14600]